MENDIEKEIDLICDYQEARKPSNYIGECVTHKRKNTDRVKPGSMQLILVIAVLLAGFYVYFEMMP
jgi:hypothetical protein